MTNQFKTTIWDCMALSAAALTALLAVCAGVAALECFEALAAVLGIAGGIISAVGILGTWQASRIRDIQLQFSAAASVLSQGGGL